MSDTVWRTTAPAFRSAWRDALAASISEHRFYLIYVAYYLVVTFSILVAHVPGAAQSVGENTVATIVGHVPFVAILFLIWSIELLIRTGPENFFPRLGRTLRESHLTSDSLARALPVLVSIPLIFGMFFALKLRIPTINPFGYDEVFAKWSNWLAGGVPTWEVLQVWFGVPWITATLNFVYYLWFPIVHVTFYWQVFARLRPALRLQFITSFAACWGLLGSFMALAFPAAGPAFLGVLSGKPTAYDGLLHYLNAVQHSGYAVSALEVQHTLWKIYATKSDVPFAGISAMPSLHVSMAVLLALFGWKINRFAGVAYTIFAGLIFIGSILLAFHYAIDGYVAGILTFVIWVACGRIARIVHPEGS